MSLSSHLDELRTRVVRALMGVLPIFFVSLFFGKSLLAIIVRPLEHALQQDSIGHGSMMASNVIEGFMTFLKIAAIVTLIVGAPWILFQLWRFIAPGLYAREKRFVYFLGPFSVLLSALGVLFMYYIMLPFALFFFVHFNASLLQRPATPVVERLPGMVIPKLPQFHGDPKDPQIGETWINTERLAVRIAIPDPKVTRQIETTGTVKEAEEPSAPRKFIAWFMGMPPPRAVDADRPVVLSMPLYSDSFVAQQYKLGEYVSLVLWFALAFAITFQTPVVVLLLGWAGLVNPPLLRKYRRHVLLICVAVAAVTTPPDAISMMALAVPMYLLFEVGIVLLQFIPASRVARGFARKNEGDDPDAANRPDDQ